MTKVKTPKKRGPKPKGHKPSGITARTKTAQRDKKDMAAVPKGEKQGAIAERKAQAEMAKLDKKAAAGEEVQRVVRELKPVAKEINVKFKLAAQLDGKADDHRLSAALLLESARQRCKEARVPFNKWCEKHVEKSYDEVCKLVAIAASPEPAKALADLRAGAAARNRDLRKRQKASRDAPANMETPWEAADALVGSLPDTQALSLIKARAGPLGMAVVSQIDQNILSQLNKDEGDPAGYNRTDLETLFLNLGAHEKLEFVQWAAREIGEELAGDLQSNVETDLTEIPDHMRRET